MSDLFVTNFNRNFTGVSATAANVVRQQMQRHDLSLVGHALPGCPAPISVATARRLSRTPRPDKRFVIWHVRRNPEMRAGIWARDMLRLPVRLVFTSAAQRLHSAYPRWLISRMDAVIATTEEAARFVPHVRAVVPHGVDTDLFAPSRDRAADWATLGHGGRFGIATIGRIRPEKGTDLFVEAMLRVLPAHPDATALVIGRAAREHQGFLDTLKTQVEKAGLSERLRFVGERPAEELPAIMRALSLVVQLPRYEGYGMVPLEAMASATPFVASDSGYFRAFCGQGRAGTVVPLEAAPAAAEAINAILGTPGRLAAAGRAAREIAVDSYSIRSEADGIEAVYNALWG